MKITNHASKRCQQRGIKLDVLEFIYKFGNNIQEDKEAIKIQITNKVRSEIIDLLDKSKNKILVIDKVRGDIITAYQFVK